MTPGQWLLLERTEHLLPELYRLGEDPDPIRLFDGTELDACEEESPLLINVQSNPSLLIALQNEPQAWPGLLMESASTSDELLAHLRHILFIRFGHERRGVLRYSRPRTASYFFPACDNETRSIWIGPIYSLRWYGGTWRDSSQGLQAWQCIENSQANQWRQNATVHELHLNTQQEKALQHQQGEHFLYQWWERQSGVLFETAWSYLRDGMNAGFVAAESLGTYLDLRRTYPNGAHPASLPPGCDADRLAYLGEYLERRSTDKERTV